MTSFLEHLSHNICRVIFWNFEMASASICRINICRISFIVKNMILVKRYNTNSNRFTFFRDKCDVIFGTFVAKHLSSDLLEFWDGVSKYLSHKHLSHNVYCKKYI